MARYEIILEGRTQSPIRANGTSIACVHECDGQAYSDCRMSMDHVAGFYLAKVNLGGAGGDINGDIEYKAKDVIDNGTIRVEHVVGATGPGEEDRALAVTVNSKDITVTFGTDSSGDSVVPTASEVVIAVQGEVVADSLVSAKATEAGTAAVGTHAFQTLSSSVLKVCFENFFGMSHAGKPSCEITSLKVV